MLLSSAWLLVVVLSSCFALVFLEEFHCGVYVHHHLECIFCPRKNQKMWQGRMISMYSGIRKGELTADLLKCLWCLWFLIGCRVLARNSKGELHDAFVQVQILVK
jgi:hypothetical protein